MGLFSGPKKRDKRNKKRDDKKRDRKKREKKRPKKKNSKSPSYGEQLRGLAASASEYTGETISSVYGQVRGYAGQAYDYTGEALSSGYGQIHGFAESVYDSTSKTISSGYGKIHGHGRQVYGYTEKKISVGYGRVHNYAEQLDETYLFIGVVTFVLIVVDMVLRRKKKRSLHRKLYGENVFPPFAPYSVMQTGSALSGKNLPYFFQRSAQKVGPIFRLRVPFLTAPLVAVGDLELAKEILQDASTTKPEAFYSGVSSIVGNRSNVLTSEGLHWKISRRGVTPAFAKEHLNRIHRVCKEKTEEWIKAKVEPSINADEPIDIGKEFTFLTLSIICKTAFEYRIKEREAQKLIADLEIVTRGFANQQVRIPLRAAFSGFPSVFQANQASYRIKNIARKMLESYRKKPQHLRSQAKTIIGCIEKNNKYASDKDRLADIVMILFAGHETTAYSLAWVFLELARNPKESLRLRDALNGSDDKLAQGLLKDVLREGMRLNPVYPGIGVRTLGRDFFVKDKAMVIPKGSQVMFPSMILTRYGVENAEQFQPSRWNDHPNKSFMLFSSGKHNCMGQSLALAEMTWVLSRLCAQYEFDVVDEGKPTFCVFWKCDGAKLKLRRVER